MHLRATTPERTRLSELPEGRIGIEATLALMVKIARHYMTDPEIIGQARDIIAFTAEKDYVGSAKQLFEYVRREIRYTPDVDGVETVQTPDMTIALGHGDCDDKSLLLATLLKAVGHPVRFVAAGFDGGLIEHVWVETLIGERWFAADTTEQNDFGWRPPRVTFQIVRNV